MTQPNAMERAKRPRSLLAGPYKHPFHPIAVTIPIGAWTASFIFDLIALFSEDKDPFTTGAQVLIAIGAIGAVVAAVLGLLDWSNLDKGTVSKTVATTHMLLNSTALILFVINYFVRAGMDREVFPTAGFVLSIIALLIVGVSGWLGGKLAYHYGVRVALERDQAEGYRFK